MKKRVIIILILLLVAVTGVIIGLKYVGKDDTKNAVNLNLYFLTAGSRRLLRRSR